MRFRISDALRAFGRSLLTIERGITTIMTKLDDLKAADAAEASAVSTALAAILALQAQHQEDLVKLTAITGPADDSSELGALTVSMQSRAKSITDALSTLQAQVTPATGAATDPAPAVEGATGTVDPAPAEGATGTTAA